MNIAGGADVFPCALGGVPQPSAPVVYRIVNLPAVLLEQLEPCGAIAAHPAVEGLRELLERDAGPVAAVEELVLEPPEEALAGRVVRGVALAGHGARHAVLLADADPAGPEVVGAPVGVAEGALAGAQLGARHQQGFVGELGVRVPGYRPSHGLAVEQVDDRQEVGLRGVGQLELGYVGGPLLVRGARAEVVRAVAVERKVVRRVPEVARTSSTAGPSCA